MNCANPECRHPMRPREATLEDQPGTRGHGGYGLCSSCYMKKWRNRGKTYEQLNVAPHQYDAWGNCEHCNRQMRPAKAKAADHPGTVAYGGYGHCGGCRARKIRTGSYADVESPDAPTIDPEAPHADALMGYYRARERRLARAERIAKFRAKYGVAA